MNKKYKIGGFIVGTLAVCLVLVGIISIVKTVGNHEVTTSVNLFGMSYQGSYDGELQKGVPNGKGIFQTDSEYEKMFSISGKWDQGVLNSKVKITYEDGSYISAKYENGLMEGRVREYFEDGSYRIYKCGSGDPYGSIKIYSQDGDLVDFDWFYETEPISKLKEEAEEVNYSDLLYYPEKVYGVPIKVFGTVKEVYATSLDTYFVLEDEAGHIYIFSYVSTASVRYGQARTANLVVGDKIIAYGYLNPVFEISLDSLPQVYLACERNEEEKLEEGTWLESKENAEKEEAAKENSLFEASRPAFRLITSELEQQGEFDRVNASFQYDDINRFSLFYSGATHTVDGIVISLNVDVNAQKLQMLVREKNSSGVFYCTGSYEELEEFPVVGDEVVIKGMLYGNYKIYFQSENLDESEQNEYVIYPRINVNNISLKG